MPDRSQALRTPQLAESEARAVGPLPPLAVIRQFLTARQHDELLQWVLANQSGFRSAPISDGVGAGNRYDSAIRSASTLRDLGPLERRLRMRLLNALPRLMRETGSRGPEPRSLELELACYGHGAHFSAHVDLAIGEGRKPLGAAPGEDRILSAVYYFHASPKRFSGGKLRLYRFGVDPAAGAARKDDFLDVEPADNSLVAFPSWALHEVRRVSSPGRTFAESRFSLNCWYCRSLGSSTRS